MGWWSRAGSFRTIVSRIKKMSQSSCYSSNRSYEETIAALNSLQTNAAYIKSVQLESVASQESRFIYVKRCSEMFGLGPKELSHLSVIHVAGTKGKGSTSAYCESILRYNGYRTGFYSSPHLVSVRERIRIDGRAISAEKFIKYFWLTFDTLQEKMDPEMSMPPYFAFLTIMAFKVFLEEGVDVAVIEVGIGGEFDTTNILPSPPVVGITSLGIDHTALLGNTLSSIAWQKAGIFKPSAVGYTVLGQASEALEILGERSLERNCPLEIAPVLEKYTWPDSQSREIALSLFRTHHLNISLALQLTNAWMKKIEKSISATALNLVEAAPFTITRKTADGVLNCRWPGRNQILELSSSTKRIKYFLDGAHTPESMKACVEWYMRNRLASSIVQHALLINITGERDRQQIIEPLLACKFDKVMFSPNIVHSFSSQGDLLNLTRSENTQRTQVQILHDLWISMTEDKDIQNGNINEDFSVLPKTLCLPSIDEALKKVQEEDGDWNVLVTGSLHLVGGVLSILDPNLEM